MFKIRTSSLPVRVIEGGLGLGIIILSITYLFNLKILLLEFYLYLLIALATPIVFISSRATSKESDVIPWYDILLGVLGGAISFYFAVNAEKIVLQDWEMGAPLPMMTAGFILCLIMIEGTRRTFGWVLAAICLVALFEPLFAHVLPGPLRGLHFSFPRIISFHAFGHESLLGPIGSACGKILIGFLLFAGMLQVSGGGSFFINMALSVIGRTRGAPAKVAVIGSGFFGMLSGAPIPNILTTGAFTIPAMKRGGYEGYYAGSVEACASTGGVVMPPVMGIAAFIMASMLDMSYWPICIAAFLPALLYFMILYVQADAYAGKNNLKPLAEEEIPQFWPTFMEGLPYFGAIIILIWFISFMRMEAQAPFYSVLGLLAIATMRKSTRMSLRQVWEMAANAFRLIAELFVLVFSLGLVIGSMALTGIAATLSFSLIDLAGNATYMIPIMGAACGYIMGIGLPASAIYIVMAVTLAPALVDAGFPLLASHLFCFYVGLLSFIIPPVALAAITAGKVAGERSVFKMGFTSMRLGMGLFVMPFLMLYCPALLIGHAPIWKTLGAFIMVSSGLLLLSCAFEQFIINKKIPLVLSVVLGFIGLAVAFGATWLF